MTTQATKPPVRSLTDWQNEVISRILQVTLSEEKAKSRPEYTLLTALNAELEEEPDIPKPPSIQLAILDRVLVARLSTPPEELASGTPTVIFDYLLACWHRCVEINAGLRQRAKSFTPDVLEERLQVVASVRELVVSYTGIILQMPDMFPQSGSVDQLGPGMLVPRLMNDDHLLSDEFLSDITKRFESDGLEDIIHPLLVGLAAKAREQTILTDYTTPLRVLMRLIENKTLLGILYKLPNWNPTGIPTRTIEMVTLLGPFMRLSVFPTDVPSVSNAYFKNAYSQPAGDFVGSINSLRGVIQNYRYTLIELANHLVRVSTDSRQATLRYLANVAESNHKRAQMQVDPRIVSTDGFMMNLLSILMALCEPFMDVRYSKIDRIDRDYYRKPGTLLNIEEETKINASKEETDAFYKDALLEQTEPNFISHCFYLTGAFTHYTLHRCFSVYEKFIRSIDDLYRRVEELKNRVGVASDINTRNAMEAMLTQSTTNLDQMVAHKYTLDAALMDPYMLQRQLRFASLMMTWLLRLVDPQHAYPHDSISLPLPNVAPQYFSMLPEYFIEDIAEIYLFILKYQPHLLAEVILDEFVNPYLRAKLTEVLAYMTYPFRGEPSGGLAAILCTHPMAVERTGASSQFYDKFNIRYNISQIVKRIWQDERHRERLREESKDMDSFVQFVNLLMNDTTYLLDEALSKLSDIRNIQTEMANTTAWEQSTQEHRQEREGQLEQDERQARSYIGSTGPFLAPEVVDRLTAMLNYNLNTLVGPKCTELKVENPKKYGFEPRSLLSSIIGIYINLHRNEFIEAMAREERSYRPERFTKAINILSKYGLKPEAEIEQLQKFLMNNVDEETLLADAPDEFLDPITYTLMRDPVTLPTSGVTMERSAIKSHLLSSPFDPFNRKALSVDMLISNDELKARIDAFIEERKKAKMM
ncbi:ubiquitin elongating factor core-domain-containing protein [Syncephalis plumigaleata]|nr:ubiquitin elongating factor core-domain-containing protein [Syncephalis plumigaleata]